MVSEAFVASNVRCPLFILISMERFHDFIYLHDAYSNPYSFLELCGLESQKKYEWQSKSNISLTIYSHSYCGAA